MTSSWMWTLITAALFTGSVLAQNQRSELGVNANSLIAAVQSALGSPNSQSSGSSNALSSQVLNALRPGGSTNQDVLSLLSQGSNNNPLRSLIQNAVNPASSQQSPLTPGSNTPGSNLFSASNSPSLRGLDSRLSGGQSISGIPLSESALSAIIEAASQGGQQNSGNNFPAGRSLSGNQGASQQESALLVGPDQSRKFYLAQDVGFGNRLLDGEEILMMGQGVVARTGQKVKIADLKHVIPVPSDSPRSGTMQSQGSPQASGSGLGSRLGSGSRFDSGSRLGSGSRLDSGSRLGSGSRLDSGSRSGSNNDRASLTQSVLNELGLSQQQRQSSQQPLSSGLLSGAGSLGRSLTPTTLGFGNSGMLTARLRNIVNGLQSQGTSQPQMGQNTGSVNRLSAGLTPNMDQGGSLLPSLGSENIANQQSLLGNQDLQRLGSENRAPLRLLDNPEYQLLQLSLQTDQAGGNSRVPSTATGTNSGGALNTQLIQLANLRNQLQDLQNQQSQGSSQQQGLQNQRSSPLQGLQGSSLLQELQRSSQLQGLQSQGSSPMQGLQSQGSSPLQSLQSQGSSQMQGLQSQGSSPMQGLLSQGSSSMQGLPSQGSSPLQSLQSQGSSSLQGLQGSSLLQELQNRGSSQQQGLRNQESQRQGGLSSAEENILMAILAQAQSGTPQSAGSSRTGRNPQGRQAFR